MVKPAAAPKPALREQFRDFARLAVLSAAEETFSTEGLRAATVEQIAARAGVSVGTIYNLFGDRDALAAELICTRRSELLAALAQTAEDSAGQAFDVRLEAVISRFFQHFREHWRFLRVVFEAEQGCSSTPVPPPAASTPCMMANPRDTIEAVRSLFEGILGDAGPALRDEGRDRHASMLVATLKHVVMLEARESTTEPDVLARNLVDVFVRGAAAA